VEEKYLELIKRDREIKAAQEALNKEINEFLASETGISGPATLLDIIFATKKKYEQPKPTIIV